MTHTIERARVDETPVPAPPPPRRSLRTVLGWAAIVVGLGTAVALALLAITSGTAPPRTETEPTSIEQPPPGVPRSADGAERSLAGDRAGVPPGVPRSADGAERSLAGDRS